MIRFYIILLTMCMTNSCASQQEASSQSDENQLFAGTFVVNTLYGRPIEGYDINLKINDRTSKISGLSGCNTYSVPFEQIKNTITFSHVTSTRILCDEEAMKIETTFFNIFSASKQFRIEKDTLLVYDNSKEILKATRFIF